MSRTRKPSPKRSRCGECGQLCRTRDGICAVCKGLIPDIDALDGGRWVNVRGVQQWVPSPETAEERAQKNGRPFDAKAPCGTEKAYQRHRWEYHQHGLGDWPLPADDPCGCRAAHRAHEAFRVAVSQQTKEVA